MVVRSDVLIDRRYLAIRRAKQEAQIRSRQRKIYRSALSAAKHCRRRPVGRRNGGGSLRKLNRIFPPFPTARPADFKVALISSPRHNSLSQRAVPPSTDPKRPDTRTTT